MVKALAWFWAFSWFLHENSCKNDCSQFMIYGTTKFKTYRTTRVTFQKNSLPTAIRVILKKKKKIQGQGASSTLYPLYNQGWVLLSSLLPQSNLHHSIQVLALLSNEKSMGWMSISCWALSAWGAGMVRVKILWFVSLPSSSGPGFLWCSDHDISSRWRYSSVSGPSLSKLDILGDVWTLSSSLRWWRSRWTGDMPCKGVPGLLEKGVPALLDTGVTALDCLLCFMCFLAAWCQFLRAFATLSLKMVGFMVDPI